MQSLQVRVDLLKCAIDVFHLVFLIAYVGNEVVATCAELVAWPHVFVDEILDHDVDEAAVLVVSDSSTVIDLGHEDLQHLVGDVLELVHVDLELPLACG